MSKTSPHFRTTESGILKASHPSSSPLEEDALQSQSLEFQDLGLNSEVFIGPILKKGTNVHSTQGIKGFRSSG